jgi:Spy/CpxP family protein refolding chaperone
MKINCIQKMTMFLAVLIFGCAVVLAEPPPPPPDCNSPPPDSNAPMCKVKRPHMREGAGWFMQGLSEKLNLTDTQKAAIKPTFANDANAIKAVRQDGSLTEEQKMAKIKEIRENGRKKINAILTPEQQKEFAELKNRPRHRMREFAENRLEMLSEKLNLTDAQKTTLKPILATEANDIKAVWQDKSLSKEQKQSKASGIREAANTKINAVLTPEQQAKWTELKKEHAMWMHHKGMHRRAPGEGPPPEEPKPADSNS